MILNTSISPAEGEVSIKAYLCTHFDSQLFGIKADGYLEVTNKRLLFQSVGKNVSGNSAIHSEVAIGDVSEIKIYKGKTFNVALFLLGVILVLIIAAAVKGFFYAALNSNVWGTLFALALSVYGIYRVYVASMKKAFSLLVNTKGGSGNVVYIAGLSPFGGGNTAASRALTAEPARDSDLLMKEIGALVLDIQNMGDNAVGKWKKSNLI